MNFFTQLPGYKYDCKLFTGYKPCKHKISCEECSEYIQEDKRILIVNLDAMGDVMMTTAMLHPLKRKYPGSSVHWITMKCSMPLLAGNRYIDKVWEYNFESLMILGNMEFDVVINADKNQNSCSILKQINAKEKYGFTLSKHGKIIPCNEKAFYSYNLGLDNELKFYKNRLTGQQILHESAGLEYERDTYILDFTDEEEAFAESYYNSVNPEGKVVIGFNTGCAPVLPMKKLSTDQHIELINKIYETFPNVLVALLGGKAEAEKNAGIESKLKHKIINTPTSHGLRKGLQYIDICDIVITGDTMAMHAAIARGKYVIAFFGPSCEQEIDLFDNGQKILPGLACSPCWNGKCPDWKCVNELKPEIFIDAIKRYFDEN